MLENIFKITSTRASRVS